MWKSEKGNTRRNDIVAEEGNRRGREQKEQQDVRFVEEIVKELKDLMWIDGEKSKDNEEKDVRKMIKAKENEAILEAGETRRKSRKQECKDKGNHKANKNVEKVGPGGK